MSRHPTPPLAQSLSALERAQQVRVDRAKIRRGITSGEIPAWRVLEDMPECMRGCGVFSFIEFLPNTGNRRAFALLREAKVPGHKRLEHLTPMQLARLIAAVRAKHPAEGGLS